MKKLALLFGTIIISTTVSMAYLDEGETYIIDANSPEAVNVPSTTRLTGNIQIAGDANKISISLSSASALN